ncbi:MAG: hypothetical protein KME27_31435 [Lyngbya sp. HA4199-MV5]|jgi:hypothetical protein|nr:hypothetical protein [Lyngbya sp. HA4199-MV5]
MTKSTAYWAAPASTEYETAADNAYAAGAAAALAGQKPNLKGIPQSHRPFYMSAYRRAL